MLWIIAHNESPTRFTRLYVDSMCCQICDLWIFFWLLNFRYWNDIENLKNELIYIYFRIDFENLIVHSKNLDVK